MNKLEIREPLEHCGKEAIRLPSLTLILPCHNDEKNIEGVVEKALKVLHDTTRDFEIIIVDDGSRDRTSERGEALCVRSLSVIMIRHREHEGYGSALRTGFKAATKDWVFYTNGDGRFNLEKLPMLLEQRHGAGAVLGYRPKGNFWSRFTGLIFGLEVRDIDCAFKLFRREDVKMRLRSRGPFVSTELLVRLKRKGVSFREVEIRS